MQWTLRRISINKVLYERYNKLTRTNKFVYIVHENKYWREFKKISWFNKQGIRFWIIIRNDQYLVEFGVGKYRLELRL